ncbi:hypothetical protein PRZ48_014328 [Zasmidium cellare]|uniref:Uncharacterized protein n=1 Tax=Zasmidium cellare TaxID=395010 RepID=A0ABR0E0P3_ZASCE|nr:hypothetical protein PRZ48_014362 [Zasmidium cellare]KAK4494972.1 hypothetical protein PRZ48_014328 [Zasmidium cellare]
MSKQRPFDRCDVVSSHSGPNVFPNFFLFSRLVRLAQKPLVAVRDVTFGFTATFTQLLTDVLSLRNALQAQFGPDLLGRIEEEEIFVLLLGPGGYEFVVGFLALIALGVVVVPISPDLPVKEALYFATKSKAIAVLTADKCLKLGEGLEAAMIEGDRNQAFRSIRIRPFVMNTPLPPEDFQVSSDRYMDLNKSAYVIFTSGTTGPPKGGVKRRGFLYDVATQFADQHGIREGDLVLHTLPVHHATGITVTLLPFLWAGGTIEFKSGGFDTVWTWERIKQGDLDVFSGVPTIYMRLMQYYEQNLRQTPTADEYVQGARRIRAMLCGTSALPRPLQQKWTTLRNGIPILTRYGGTEFANVFGVTPWLAKEHIPDGSVGIRSAGTDVKLTGGDEGEVLVRSPLIFNKYLFDDEATVASMDEQGYFKTGDIARKEGKFYFILGRASIDIIKSGGYKLSALDIEREILGLEYVSEVMVVGVEDEEYGQRVAAAVVLRQDLKEHLTIDELRGDLRTSLAGYKMPTVLRIVPELRKNATGKVMKKVLVKELFPVEGHPDVQRWQSPKKASKL